MHACMYVCTYICTYVTENTTRDLGHTVCRDFGIFYFFRCPRLGVLLLGVVVCFVLFCFVVIVDDEWSGGGAIEAGKGV